MFLSLKNRYKLFINFRDPFYLSKTLYTNLRWPHEPDPEDAPHTVRGLWTPTTSSTCSHNNSISSPVCATRMSLRFLRRAISWLDALLVISRGGRTKLRRKTTEHSLVKRILESNRVQ